MVVFPVSVNVANVSAVKIRNQNTVAVAMTRINILTESSVHLFLLNTYSFKIRFVDLRQTTKNVSQDSRFPNRDFNPRLSRIRGCSFEVTFS